MRNRDKILLKKLELNLVIKDNHDRESCKEIDLFIKNEQIINDPKLINNDFGESDEFRYWLFLKNQFNFAISAMHINADKKIYNNVTLYPCKSWDGLNQVLSAQCGDTYTNMYYQGLGLFDEAVKESIQKMSEKKHYLIYSFPNQYALPSYVNRMNFKKVEYGIKTQLKRTSLMSLLFKILPNSPVKIIRLFKSIDPLNKLLKIESILTRQNKQIQFIRTKKIGDEFDEFWRNERKNIKLLNVRDSKFLNWRYLLNKKDFEVYKIIHKKEFSGFFVILELNDPSRPNFKNLWLVDWFYSQKNKVFFEKEILKVLKNHAQKRNIDNIIIQQSESSPLGIKSNFKNVGKSRPLVIHKNEIGNKYLNQLYPWHFTLGDTDHF